MYCLSAQPESRTMTSELHVYVTACRPIFLQALPVLFPQQMRRGGPRYGAWAARLEQLLSSMSSWTTARLRSPMVVRVQHQPGGGGPSRTDLQAMDESTRRCSHGELTGIPTMLTLQHRSALHGESTLAARACCADCTSESVMPCSSSQRGRTS